MNNYPGATTSGTVNCLPLLYFIFKEGVREW